MTMDGQDPQMANDVLSGGQEIVLHVLTICSASLSVIGSSAIMFKILQEIAQNRSRFMTPYDRIILGLSTCDIMATITYAIDQFLLPSESGKWSVWTFGSPTTCQAVGFLTQLAPLWAIWYNCILSYYFLLRVLSQKKRIFFVQKYELWMHLSGLYFPITAIIGYFGNWYEVGSGCWISDPTIKWIVAGIPTLFTYLSLIFNNMVIYAVLRKSLRSSEPAQKRLMREATTLMFLYVGCFFVTISPQLVLHILEDFFDYTNNDYGNIYPLLVLSAMTMPLQGFFNVFIYIKPAYTRFRAADPNKSIYFVLRQALFNPKVPQLTFLGDQSAASAIAEGDAVNPNQALFNSNFRPNSSSTIPASSSDPCNTIAEGSNAA